MQLKNRHILILAANAREGAKYAKNSDLPNFTYRVVRSSSSITGIQSVDVHMIDGWDSRPDAGAILAKLRWARDIEYYSVSMPPEPVKDQGDGMGEQLEIGFDGDADDPDPKIVGRRKSVDPVIKIVTPQPAADSLDHVVQEDTAAERAGESTNGDTMVSEGAPANEPKKRRSRCKTCGRLTKAPYAENREGHDEATHSTGFFA